MTISLYCLTSPSGKSYIGLSVDVPRRRRNHAFIAKSGAKPGHPLYGAIAKYGMDAFAVSILDTFKTDEEARRAETFAIAALGTLAPAGYNISAGGDYDAHAGGAAAVAMLAADPWYLEYRRIVGHATARHLVEYNAKLKLTNQVARNERPSGKPLRFVHTDSEGRIYFRRAGLKVRMAPPMWSDAFMARYRELVSQSQTENKSVQPETGLDKKVSSRFPTT